MAFLSMSACLASKGVIPSQIMKRLILPAFIACLLMCGNSSAHHGDDFILLEDYSMPAVWRPQVTSTLDWEKFGSIDTLQTEPTLYFTPMPRIGFSLAARFADESGDWALSSVTPRIHVQLTDPKSKFPIRVGFSIGYQFGIDMGDDDHHAQGSGSASHSHDADHQHGSSSKTKNGKKKTQPEHDHSDHSHDDPSPSSGAPAPAEHNHDDGSHTHPAPAAPVTAADPAAPAVPVTSAPVTTVPADPNVPHDHSTHDHGPTTPCDPNVDVDCEGVPLPAPPPPIVETSQTQATSAPAPPLSTSTTPVPAAPAPANNAPAESAPPAPAPAPAADAAPNPTAAQEEAPAQQQSADPDKKSKRTQSKSEKKKKPKAATKAPSSGAHAHSHNQNQWIGRLVVEANFGSTKILANLIGVSPEDGSPSWGYAAGVRHQFTHKLALGVEAIGDFVDHGQHEIILGGYMTPVHSLTFKIGAGFGLTEASPDFTLRSGFVVRF